MSILIKRPAPRRDVLRGLIGGVVEELPHAEGVGLDGAGAGEEAAGAFVGEVGAGEGGEGADDEVG